MVNVIYHYNDNACNNIDYFCDTTNFNSFITWFIQYQLFMRKMLHSHDISKFGDLERSWVSSLEWQDSTAVHLLQAIFFFFHNQPTV